MVKTYKRSAVFISTVTSGQAAATTFSMDVASGQAPTNDFYFIGQVRRAGVDVAGFDFDYTSGTGMLAVSNAGSAALAENDVVTIMGAWTRGSNV